MEVPNRESQQQQLWAAVQLRDNNISTMSTYGSKKWASSECPSMLLARPAEIMETTPKGADPFPNRCGIYLNIFSSLDNPPIQQHTTCQNKETLRMTATSVFHLSINGPLMGSSLIYWLRKSKLANPISASARDLKRSSRRGHVSASCSKQPLGEFSGNASLFGGSRPYRVQVQMKSHQSI